MWNKIFKYGTYFFSSSAATYMTIKPSLSYVQNSSYFNKITIPASTISSAFLINLNAITEIAAIYQLSENKKYSIKASLILGAISAIPTFFMQYSLEKDDIAFALLSATITFLGTISLQSLGAWDYFEKIHPYAYLFKTLFKNNTSQQGMREPIKKYLHYLKTLDNGMINMLYRGVPEDYQSIEPIYLLDQIAGNQTLRVNQSKINCMTAKLSSSFGVVGILLSESINLSFMLATYTSLNIIMPNWLGGILTALVSLPMLILSADFGFNALETSATRFFELCKSVYEYFRYKQPIELNDPLIAIHPLVGLFTYAVSMLIASRSYAALVEFNNQTLDDVFSEFQLYVINLLTMTGGLIFNSYAVVSIGEKIASEVMCYHKKFSIQEKAKFYKHVNELKLRYRDTIRQRFFVTTNVNQYVNLDGIKEDDLHVKTYEI